MPWNSLNNSSCPFFSTYHDQVLDEAILEVPVQFYRLVFENVCQGPFRAQLVDFVLTRAIGIDRQTDEALEVDVIQGFELKAKGQFPNYSIRIFETYI